MKIYGIVYRFEDYFSDESSYVEDVKHIMFTEKEDAYNKIIAEIKNEEFENPYGEPIILEDAAMPTIDDLLSGWWYRGDIYSIGYEIREYFLSD